MRSMLCALQGAATSQPFETHPTPVTPAANPELAAAFTPSGRLSESEQQRLVNETALFREH